MQSKFSSLRKQSRWYTTKAGAAYTWEPVDSLRLANVNTPDVSKTGGLR